MTDDRDPALGERISDPRRVRALAHPLRLRLLDLLGDGELTATECAAATGESVASCSFHLRTLAKYGYIAPGERRGREKPWRLVSRSRDIRADLHDRASVQAVQVMAALAIDQATDHVRAWVEQATLEDAEWIDASTITTAATWVTVEEMAELSRSVQHLTDRFAGRLDDPTRRPPGARPIRLLGAVSVDLEREARAAGGDDHDLARPS